VTEPDDKEAILYAFAVEDSHDRETLERYLREYPELSEELIDLSSEIRLSKVLGAPTAEVKADPGFEPAWQQFLASGPEKTRQATASNPFATFKGEAFVQLAKLLDVPRNFLTPLRDGLVAATSIPIGFTQRLAQAMGVSVAILQSHFAGGRPNLEGLSFKSDDKPARQGQMTFRELVDKTGMSDSQRQSLLRDLDGHGLD
jgi:hypothetical protein